MNNCLICKTPCKNKTCSKECLSKLRSINSTELKRKGVVSSDRGRNY